MLKHITEVLSNMVGYVETNPPRTEFRASSLPYCGVLDYYNRLCGKDTSFDYGGFHYTTIGTAVHETVQDKIFLSNKGMLWGTWRCSSCNALSYNQHEPETCPKCKCGEDRFKYEEAEVAYPKSSFKKMQDAAIADNVLMTERRKLVGVNTFTGHVDGVIRLDGKYYILEYKTTSDAKVTTGRGLPVSYHHCQAGRYSALVTYLHGIKISGYFLIYIGRDKAANVTKSLTGKVKLEGIRPFFYPTGDGFNKKELAKMRNEFMQRKAGTLLLRGDVSKEAFLIKNKPCSSIAGYKEKMFNGYKEKVGDKLCYPCPLAESGKCFTMRKLPAYDKL